MSLEYRIHENKNNGGGKSEQSDSGYILKMMPTGLANIIKPDIEYEKKEDSCVCSEIQSLHNWVPSGPVVWDGDHQKEIWRGN